LSRVFLSFWIQVLFDSLLMDPVLMLRGHIHD
jgi:hypothetical protein